MKKHYYFVKGVVTFQQMGKKETYNKQDIYEIIQKENESDKELFLNLEHLLELEIARSLIKYDKRIKQEDILTIRVTLISRLN
jgi:hypothetical protein